jgi:ferredoxin
MLATGERIRANAWGPYYVSNECNGCGLCAYIAPFNFSPSWDGSYLGVAAQPDDPAENVAMEDARASCPLHCIHDDGDR